MRAFSTGGAACGVAASSRSRIRPRGWITACGAVMQPLLLLLAVSAHAATLWVVPPGSDGNPATEQQPVASLAAAMRLAKPGDTVLLKPGRYPAGQSCVGRGTAEAPITIRAAGEGVVIEGTADEKPTLRPAPGKPGLIVTEERGTVAGVAVDLANSVYGVDNLDATNDLATLQRAYQGYWLDRATGLLYLRYHGGEVLTGHTVHVMRDGGGLTVAGAYLRIEGLALRNLAGGGVGIAQAQHITLSHCQISRCGFQWSAAVGLWQTEDVTIDNCLIYRARNGIIAQDAARTTVSHNTIYHTRAHGVYLIGGAGDVLCDNILYAGGNSGSALYVDRSGAEGLQCDYNCYLDTGSTALVSWMPVGLRFPTFDDYHAAITGEDQNSLSADPGFVSTAPGQEDFHLRPDSPCRSRASDGGDMGIVWPKP